MKRGIFLLLLCCLLLNSLAGCSSGPKTYKDPFRKAKDGEVFSIAGTTAHFYDTTDVTGSPTTIEFAPYTRSAGYTPKTNYYLIEILDLREISFDYESISTQGKAMNLSFYRSIIQAEIITVFHDSLEEPLQEGDIVRINSPSRKAEAIYSVYIPELTVGGQYYVQMGPVTFNEENALPYQLAIAELSDYWISFTCFDVMPLRSDGMVEYLYGLMPGGKILPYEWNTGRVLAQLPQEEFEAGFRAVIDTYCMAPGE